MTDRVQLLDVAGTPERKLESELDSLLASCVFSVRCAGDIDAAIVMLGEHAPSLAVINIGSANLVDADHALRILAGVPVVVVCSGHDADLIVRWLEAGADTVLVGPLSRRELDARIKAVLGWHSSSARGAAGSSMSPAAPR